MEEMYKVSLNLKDDWYFQKHLLRHPSCPDSLRGIFVNSKVWYKRIVAMFAKPARGKYTEWALFDSDIRVRRVAFNMANEGLKSLALRDNLAKNREKVLQEKLKLIDTTPALALLDEYKWVREFAYGKLECNKKDIFRGSHCLSSTHEKSSFIAPFPLKSSLSYWISRKGKKYSITDITFASNSAITLSNGQYYQIKPRKTTK